MANVERAKRGSHDLDMLDSVVTNYHPDLDAHGVTVGLEFASIGEEEAVKGRHAISVGGVGVVTLTRITPVAQRRYGVPDAIIQVDKSEWDDMASDERVAALDHAVARIVVAKDKDGMARIDACLRPKLRRRVADIVVSGFRDVAIRHGDAALEVRALRSLMEQRNNVQAFFPFMAEPAFVRSVEESLAVGPDGGDVEDVENVENRDVA